MAYQFCPSRSNYYLIQEGKCFTFKSFLRLRSRMAYRHGSFDCTQLINVNETRNNSMRSSCIVHFTNAGRCSMQTSFSIAVDASKSICNSERTRVAYVAYYNIASLFIKIKGVVSFSSSSRTQNSPFPTRQYAFLFQSHRLFDGICGDVFHHHDYCRCSL